MTFCVFRRFCVSMVCVWESQSVVHQYHNLQLNQLVSYEANTGELMGVGTMRERKWQRVKAGRETEKKEMEKKMRQMDKEKTKLVLIASDDHIRCTNIRLGKVQTAKFLWVNGKFFLEKYGHHWVWWYFPVEQQCLLKTHFWTFIHFYWKCKDSGINLSLTSK